MAGEFVFNVSAKDFIKRVIEKSKQTPVLVDFWAEWCAPCRTLGPMLERIVNSLNGQVLLAKVDVDKNQELAAQMRIQSIPAVAMFVKGKIADSFVGALPEEEIIAFIEKHLPEKADKPYDNALKLFKSGRLADAEKLLRQIIVREPQHQDAVELLVRILLMQFKIDDADKAISGIEVPTKGMELLRNGFDFWREVASVQPDWKPSADAKELDNLLKAAEFHAKDKRSADAMEQLLEIVKRDKSYRDAIGKRALVFLFVLIGGDDPLVREYQMLLSRNLY
jgi:putative thioredoxin